MQRQLSDREIDQILYRLKDKIDFHEHDRVKEMLQKARSGGLYKDELHKELVRLQEEHKISESDHKAIEDAIFGK